MQADLDQPNLDRPNLDQANLEQANLGQANLDQKDFQHIAEQHGWLTAGVLKLARAVAGAILLPFFLHHMPCGKQLMTGA